MTMFQCKNHHIFSSTRMKKHKGLYLRICIWALLSAMLFSSCACGSSANASSAVSKDGSMAVFSRIAEKYQVDTSVWDTHVPTLPAAVSGISARSAVLLRADTGEILYGQNHHVRLPMASTTKIMTALVATEALPLDTPVCVTSEAVGVEGSSIYLTEGETLSLEALLYALLLESANDAAVAIAVACAGSVEDFAALMNKKAEALGLQNTHFINPHGLDHPDHYTTAYELGLIAKAALSYPALSAIMSTPKATIPHHGEDGVRLLVNHNKLLRSYEGAIGVKTGFTKKSGRCLVSAAQRDSLTLVAVTLNAPDDWRDHTTLLDYGFSLFEQVELCKMGEYEQPLWVVGGVQDYVMIKNKQGLTLPLYKGYGKISCVVELPHFVYADVTVDQEVGRLLYYAQKPDGSRVELGRVPLYAAYAVEKVTYKRTFKDFLKDLFS